jgi:hypothetical protein
MQPPASQLRKRRQVLAQIGLERPQLGYPRLARTLRWRLQALSDVSTHCLAVEDRSARDGRDVDTQAVRLEDHNDLPKSDQRRTPRLFAGGMKLCGDVLAGAVEENVGDLIMYETKPLHLPR